MNELPYSAIFFAQYIHHMHSVVNKKVGIVRFSDLVIIAFNYKESNFIDIVMSTNLYYLSTRCNVVSLLV